VLNKPIREFSERNASKNAAGFKINDDAKQKPDTSSTSTSRDPLIVEVPTVLMRIEGQLRIQSSEPPRKNPCCGNVGTHGEGGREYCSTCGQEIP
jgi:hypothetical protein